VQRTTITLPEDLLHLARREAERRGTSVSEVVRISLTRLLRGEESRAVPWAGLVSESAMVYGAAIDDALGERWADDIARDRR
jgi:Arc/MetJ-type ribon-helix-helix transcriptional regulator